MGANQTVVMRTDISHIKHRRSGFKPYPTIGTSFDIILGRIERNRKGTKRNPLRLKELNAYRLEVAKKKIMEDFFLYGHSEVKIEGNRVTRVSPKNWKGLEPSVADKISTYMDEIQLAQFRFQNAIAKSNGNN